METIVTNPPQIIVKYQQRGVCFHVDKPCFTIKAHENKTQKSSFDKIRFKNRMISASKTAQSPDMNLTLKEIQNGFTREEKVKATLFVYFSGVMVLLLLFDKF